MGQASTGEWTSDYLIHKFVSKADQESQCDLIMDEVKSLISDASKFAVVWNTILAVYILTTKFKNKQGEWNLIV